MLKPTNVFRPGKLPINPGNVYASRGQAQTDLETALERGFVPLIFGEYGVGKTSMVRYVLKPYEEANRLVNIESAAGKSMQDVFSSCLEKIGYTIERKTITERKLRTLTNKLVKRQLESAGSKPKSPQREEQLALTAK